MVLARLRCAGDCDHAVFAVQAALTAVARPAGLSSHTGPGRSSAFSRGLADETEGAIGFEALVV
eukprot:CAMPEP_0170279686 /NCGR_PEP_ID=MMETSP0116_2-20130129/39855_1 /TAXON_ID=400756 /ORGANISM="Durinskia baltica, Strain CSIRO CS-38" /LENGTH=63 /DNA_ID=CAMNT_0010531013 /DNA_START=93 /DNA_END=284 /DNA_ORIENTATION=-